MSAPSSSTAPATFIPVATVRAVRAAVLAAAFAAGRARLAAERADLRALRAVAAALALEARLADFRPLLRAGLRVDFLTDFLFRAGMLM
jgi:hypothetical protein